MGFDFSFREIADTSDVRCLVDFISKQDLGYPGYHSWVERTEAELLDGGKEAVLAHSNGVLVGDLIHQKHKDLFGMLEIKNLRVHPGFRIRRFASFMLRQAEVEAAQRGFQGVIADARIEQVDVANFLFKEGYTPVATGPLYDEYSPDTTFVKTLRHVDAPRVLVAGRIYAQNRFL